jgi:hypothetical protein
MLFSPTDPTNRLFTPALTDTATGTSPQDVDLLSVQPGQVCLLGTGQLFLETDNPDQTCCLGAIGYQTEGFSTVWAGVVCACGTMLVFDPPIVLGPTPPNVKYVFRWTPVQAGDVLKLNLQAIVRSP